MVDLHTHALLAQSINMLHMAGMPSLPLLTSARLSSSDWAQSLLTECANAISENDLGHAQQLLWVLNELSSPYGSHEQRLAYYFMQALFCKMSGTGPRTHLSLCVATERTNSFESMRKTMLKFQEASPWVTFGHVAANGALMEAMEGESSVHIIDVSSTFCTQWPTLLEALATRAEGAPSVRLSTVPFNEDGGVPCTNTVMEEVGMRLEKFARLMGVPFQFNLVQAHDLQILLEQEIAERHLSMQQYGARGGTKSTALMVSMNCVSALHNILHLQRQGIMSKLKRLKPKIMTLVEDMEAEKDRIGASGGGGYAERFGEALRFYALYFEAMEGSMGKVSSERGALERGAGRRIMKKLGCEQVQHQEDGDDDDEEKEEEQDIAGENMQGYMSRSGSMATWRERLQRAGFLPKPFSDDVVDDVRALLKRYRDGWGLHLAAANPPPLPSSSSSDLQASSSPSPYSLSLTWKDHPVIFASTWRLPTYNN